jgi:uncharacterized lipoprotein YddW (UPF0748 family)
VISDIHTQINSLTVSDYKNMISTINSKITAIQDQNNSLVIHFDYRRSINSIENSITDLEDQINNSMVPNYPNGISNINS